MTSRDLGCVRLVVGQSMLVMVAAESGEPVIIGRLVAKRAAGGVTAEYTPECDTCSEEPKTKQDILAIYGKRVAQMKPPSKIVAGASAITQLASGGVMRTILHAPRSAPALEKDDIIASTHAAVRGRPVAVSKTAEPSGAPIPAVGGRKLPPRTGARI